MYYPKKKWICYSSRLNVARIDYYKKKLIIFKADNVISIQRALKYITSRIQYCTWSSWLKKTCVFFEHFKLKCTNDYFITFIDLNKRLQLPTILPWNSLDSKNLFMKIKFIGNCTKIFNIEKMFLNSEKKTMVVGLTHIKIRLSQKKIFHI